jgi:hypothetical protein
MFIALAIVCDEFFVPSLDVIIEKGMYTEKYVVVLLVHINSPGTHVDYIQGMVLRYLFIEKAYTRICRICSRSFFKILIILHSKSRVSMKKIKSAKA